MGGQGTQNGQAGGQANEQVGGRARKVWANVVFFKLTPVRSLLGKRSLFREEEP